MGPGSHPPPAVLEAARRRAGLSPSDLWIRYVALGGSSPPRRVRGFMLGGEGLSAFEYDLIALALNERFSDMELDSPVPYSDEGASD